MRTFVLDGDRFDDMEGFYDEIDALLTAPDLGWRTGHNLDAFNDLLRGGFGVHGYGEPIVLRWVHYRRSIEMLGEARFWLLVEIILNCDHSGHDCKLELYEREEPDTNE